MSVTVTCHRKAVSALQKKKNVCLSNLDYPSQKSEGYFIFFLSAVITKIEHAYDLQFFYWTISVRPVVRTSLVCRNDNTN